MVTTHLTLPHSLYCITDEPEGIDSSVTTVPLWSAPKVISKNWNNGRPQCYRRARLFDPEISGQLDGTHVVNMDLDLVVVNNIDHLFASYPSFRIMHGGTSRNPYNGSMWMFRQGTHQEVWSMFSPELAARASGQYLGSDQAWFRYALGPHKQVWGRQHGAWQFVQLRKTIYKNSVPKEIAIVFFAGMKKPWQSAIQHHYPWIKEAWGPSKEYERTWGPTNKRLGSSGKSGKIKDISIFLPDMQLDRKPKVC
jgi:hypothetical protein